MSCRRIPVTFKNVAIVPEQLGTLKRYGRKIFGRLVTFEGNSLDEVTIHLISELADPRYRLLRSATAYYSFY